MSSPPVNAASSVMYMLLTFYVVVVLLWALRKPWSGERYQFIGFYLCVLAIPTYILLAQDDTETRSLLGFAITCAGALVVLLDMRQKAHHNASIREPSSRRTALVRAVFGHTKDPLVLVTFVAFLVLCAIYLLKYGVGS